MHIKQIIKLAIFIVSSLNCLCHAEEAYVYSLTDQRVIQEQDSKNTQKSPQGNFQTEHDENQEDAFAFDISLEDLEAFEAEHPMQDLSFESKMQLAWEYLKIKISERKGYVIGGSALVILSGIAAWHVYKKYSVQQGNNQ